MEPIGLLLNAAALYPLCIQGYRTFTTIKDFQNDSSTLFWSLKKQELRFITWGEAYGLTDTSLVEDRQTLAPSQFERHSTPVLEIVHSLLIAMQDVMLDVDKLVSRYGLENLDPVLSDQTAQKGRQTPLKLRVRWAIRDRKAFGALVGELKDSNDALHATLTPMLLQMVDFDVRNQVTASAQRIEDLQSIKAMDEGSKLLHNLACFKTLNLGLHDQRPTTLGREDDWRIEMSDLRVTKDLISTGLWHTVWNNTCSVLVEWKYYEAGPGNHGGATLQLTGERINKLLQLLTSEYKPQEVQVLDCLGYTHDKSNHRFGIVYNLYDWTLGPNPSSGKVYNSKVWFTLEELIRDRPKMPLLGHRVQLALILTKSMIQMHATGWLHKGYDSGKVVFFSDDASGQEQGALPTSLLRSEVDLCRPKVIGFDYSRPGNRSEYSEYTDKFLVNHSEAHIHPDYLALVGTGLTSDASTVHRYRTEYDMFSLGCVLLEIGLWRLLSPIWNLQRDQDPARWKHRLCNKYVSDLGARCGEKYQLVVHSLLTQTDAPTAQSSAPLTNFELIKLLEGIHT